jgi:hypothetical protein
MSFDDTYERTVCDILEPEAFATPFYSPVEDWLGNPYPNDIERLRPDDIEAWERVDVAGRWFTYHLVSEVIGYGNSTTSA